MDGILVLVLIGWIISQMSKKNKKTKARVASGFQKEKTSQPKAARAAKTYAEIEKRKAQTIQEKTAAVQHAFGEGESAVSPFPMEESFRGSMQAESMEGECICDPELEHEREQVTAPESVYAGEIGREPIVDVSARGLMQGIVMNEILTRPAQRARRR